MQANQFSSSIIGHEMVDPEQLLANPKNFRIHSKQQQDAMEAALKELGWIDEIIVNQRTGVMINGHMRVRIALRAGEATVPVRYVDLSEEHENLALATFDNVSGLATIDRDQLSSLLQETNSESDILSAFLDSLKPGEIPSGEEAMADNSNEDLGEEQWLILVTCATEQEQFELLEQFEHDGIVSKALNTA